MLGRVSNALRSVEYPQDFAVVMSFFTRDNPAAREFAEN